jgi:hypothetical protein
MSAARKVFGGLRGKHSQAAAALPDRPVLGECLKCRGGVPAYERDAGGALLCDDCLARRRGGRPTVAVGGVRAAATYPGGPPRGDR